MDKPTPFYNGHQQQPNEFVGTNVNKQKIQFSENVQTFKSQELKDHIYENIPSIVDPDSDDNTTGPRSPATANRSRTDVSLLRHPNEIWIRPGQIDQSDRYSQAGIQTYGNLPRKGLRASSSSSSAAVSVNPIVHPTVKRRKSGRQAKHPPIVYNDTMEKNFRLRKAMSKRERNETGERRSKRSKSRKTKLTASNSVDNWEKCHSSILHASPFEIMELSGVSISEPLGNLPTIEQRHFKYSNLYDTNYGTAHIYPSGSFCTSPGADFFNEDIASCDEDGTKEKIINLSPGQPVRIVGKPIYLPRRKWESETLPARSGVRRLIVSCDPPIREHCTIPSCNYCCGPLLTPSNYIDSATSGCVKLPSNYTPAYYGQSQTSTLPGYSYPSQNASFPQTFGAMPIHRPHSPNSGYHSGSSSPLTEGRNPIESMLISNLRKGLNKFLDGNTDRPIPQLPTSPI